MRIASLVIALLLGLPSFGLPLQVAAQTLPTLEPSPFQDGTFTVIGRQATASFTLAELRGHPKVVEVKIADDPVFHRAMTYRGVPTAELFGEVGLEPDDYVQARATDRFSISIPARLLLQGGGVLALEDPAKPWPRLQKAGESFSAGPFYLVWPKPLTSGRTVSSEFWAYRLAAFEAVVSPIRRWPQLAVGADQPPGSPARIGLNRFITFCIACHKFNGGGEGTQGPDLGKPMNAVDYFQPQALKKLLRDPDSVRSWPGRQMPAFTAEMLSDGEIDAILAWLAYKAEKH